MGTSKKILILALATIFIFSFVAWNKNNKEKNSNQKSTSAYNAAFSSYVNFSDFTSADDEFDWVYNASKSKRIPPADDVMVQRIPGDNFHLLVMAVYTYAAYHEPTVTMNNGGENIVLH